MDDDSNDDFLARFMQANRVSLRAVLVADGQDASQELLDSGILDPVAVSVVFDDDVPGGGMLNPGPTEGLVATLEQDQADNHDDADGSASASPAAAQIPAKPAPAATTTTLPAAYGKVPLAPVRSRS